MAGSVVQSNSVQAASSAIATQAVAFASNNTAGNKLWIVGFAPAGTTITVADSNLNTYSLLDTYNTTVAMRQWEVVNCAAGANIVTLSYSPSATGSAIFILEAAGVSNVAANQHAQNNQVNPAASTGSVTTGSVTTTATALALAFSVDISGHTKPAAAGTGFTSISATLWNFGGGPSGSAEFKASVAAGSVASTFTPQTASETFETFGVWFTESAAPLTLIGQILT